MAEPRLDPFEEAVAFAIREAARRKAAERAERRRRMTLVEGGAQPSRTEATAMGDKDRDQLRHDEDEAYDELRRVINRDRPQGKRWTDIPSERQRQLRSAAESYAADDEPYDAARAAIRRGEREGWFR